jgi:hypothetical protein
MESEAEYIDRILTIANERDGWQTENEKTI